MIIGPALVVPGGPEPRVLEEGGVRIAGAHIAQVAPIGTLASSFRDETVWPAGGRLLLPGLVNAHAHLARHLARGLDRKGPIDWERYDRALAPEDVRWAALACLVEGVRHGVTTTCDLHRSGAFVDFSLSEVSDAATRLGVRVATAYAAHEEDSIAQRLAAHEESLGLAREIARSRQGRVQALLGIRARTAQGLERMLASEASRGDLGLHVELPAGEGGGGPGIARNARRPSLWAHVESVRPALRAELDGVAALGVALEADAAFDSELAWGSDSGVNAPPVLDPAAAHDPERALRHYRRVLVSGARWAEQVFGEGLGSIEPGSPADLILVDYYPSTEVAIDTIHAHLGAAIGRAPVTGAMVAGEIVMDHGVFVGIDEAEVTARARECSARVWRRL